MSVLVSIDELEADRCYMIEPGDAPVLFAGWSFNSGSARLVFRCWNGGSAGYDELLVDRWIREGCVALVGDEEVAALSGRAAASRLSAFSARGRSASCRRA